eukprot:TRINITY_DN14227_c0_g1_i2.p2 TRINITY_DN14227_c0_g1~~TRINITY_DN14227_c0_g1_i2.p2  ORF type:complete len:110 (+),score=0.89 TRINITY_DN14227_c0_g1_i2:211-540(+)
MAWHGMVPNPRDVLSHTLGGVCMSIPCEASAAAGDDVPLLLSPCLHTGGAILGAMETRRSACLLLTAAAATAAEAAAASMRCYVAVVSGQSGDRRAELRVSPRTSRDVM